MKTTTLTLLALLFAGVITLQAQLATASEAAWDVIRTAHPESPETAAGAVALKDQILAQPTLTVRESSIAQRITTKNADAAANEVMLRTLAASSKTGPGMSHIRAHVKFLDGDMAGWTPEMFATQSHLATRLSLANRMQPPAFATSVWNEMQNFSVHPPMLRIFFKNYRATLQKPAQIAATQRQKELLLVIPQRDVSANAWLAEISADLIALQLDQ